MNNKFVILLLVIVLLFSIIYHTHNKEGFTIADISKANAIKKTKESGFSTGFAGSGSGIDSSIYANDKGFFDPAYNTPYYDSNNYSAEYHDTIDVILSKPDAYGLPKGTAWALNPLGNKVVLLDPKVVTNFTYYEPGTYSKFGSQNYVPSYEDSIYLSKTYNFIPKSL